MKLTSQDRDVVDAGVRGSAHSGAEGRQRGGNGPDSASL